MDHEAMPDPLDAIEAFTVRARAQMDGMNTELRRFGRSRRLRDRAYALRDELDARMRVLDEIAE